MLVISIIGLLLVVPYGLFVLLAYFFVTTGVAAFLAQKVLTGFGGKENLMLAVTIGVVGTTIVSRIPVAGPVLVTGPDGVRHRRRCARRGRLASARREAAAALAAASANAAAWGAMQDPNFAAAYPPPDPNYAAPYPPPVTPQRRRSPSSTRSCRRRRAPAVPVAPPTAAGGRQRRSRRLQTSRHLSRRTAPEAPVAPTVVAEAPAAAPEARRGRAPEAKRPAGRTVSSPGPAPA